MIKLLATLLFFFAAAASAAERPFTLDSIRLESLGRLLPQTDVQITPAPLTREAPVGEKYFNAYVLKAVDYLYARYKLLGYNINSVLTHDIPYDTGTISATHAPRTMCVAAQMEVILTAYQIYAKETGDHSLYSFLPQRSFEGQGINDLKGHIWVNHEFNSYGTADALINFGMAERTPFEKLTPGSFVNINRTSGSGHAVTFINYINLKGEIQPEYNESVAGFKYFSSQGGAAAGAGGFDYRYAVFSKFGCPVMPYKRDCKVIYSADQKMLNTGTMLMPGAWQSKTPQYFPGGHGPSPDDGAVPADTVFDGQYFDGQTTDD